MPLVLGIRCLVVPRWCYWTLSLVAEMSIYSGSMIAEGRLPGSYASWLDVRQCRANDSSREAQEQRQKRQIHWFNYCCCYLLLYPPPFWWQTRVTNSMFIIGYSALSTILFLLYCFHSERKRANPVWWAPWKSSTSRHKQHPSSPMFRAALAFPSLCRWCVYLRLHRVLTWSTVIL